MKKFCLIFLFAFFWLLQSAAGQGTINPEEWDHRMRIEIDHGKVDAELNEFPVAVMLDESNFDFSLAEEDGSDIRFTDKGGENLLYFERELHDQSGQQAVYWVRLPAVSDTENTVFYVYYGNSEVEHDGADDSGNVWDDNFQAVFHMDHYEDESDWLINNSISGWFGKKISENSPSQVPGKIGFAQEFDGNDKITLQHHSRIDIDGNFAMSVWVKPEIQEPSPLLDEVDGAVAAYSLRKLCSEYNDDAVKVRRSSDNQTQDIGFDEYGNLDIDALLAFVGENHGYVVTWYNQSGNGKDVTQNVEGNQPMIVEDGEVLMSDGRPMVRFDDNYLEGDVDMGSQYPDATLNAVWRQTGDGTASEVPVFLGENDIEKGLNIGYLYFPSSGPYPEVRENVLRLWEWQYPSIAGYSTNLKVQTGTYENIGAGSSEMQVFIDGDASTVKTDANEFDVGIEYENTNITIGANEDGSDYLQNSFVAEIVVYDKVLTTEEREKLESNQFKCYGFTTPVIAGKGRDAYQLEYDLENFIGYINGDTIITPANIGEYQHVAMTYDQTDLKLFINGNEVRSKSLTGEISTNSDDLIIGELFEGIIDEVRVSNIARSDEWILADYQSGTDDLLVFDLSGFDIVDPGSQEAGEPFDIDLTNARDIYGDNLEGDIDVTVTSSVETEGEGENGVLYNDELNFSEGVATIPDIELKTAGEHTLTISIDGVSDDETVDIDVGAAIAHAIVFITSEHTITANDTTEIITIQLQDEYGNEAVSSGETTINLSSDLTGTFRNEANDDDITFVTVPDEVTQASFRYTSTAAGNHELSVTDDEEILEGDTQILTVNADEPHRIVFITEEQIVYTGEVSEIITIQLEDEYGNAVESDGGTTVSLDNDTWDGEFLDDEGNELSTSNQVEIIDGHSEVSFTYRPDEAGTHELTAEASGLEQDTHNLIATDLKTWTGEESSEWDNAENWDPSGVPDDEVYIKIPETSNDPEISSSVTLIYLDIENKAVLTIETGGDLTINSGGCLTVKPGGSITADGEIINNAGHEGLVVESSEEGTGSLILSESGNNDNVEATVQRFIKGNAWYIVSPPVAGQSISGFILNDDNDIPYNPSGGYYAITHYDENHPDYNNGYWADYYPGDKEGDLESGKSYLVRRRDDGVLTFEGTLLNSNQGVEISDEKSGWNSIGNPFSSSLRARGENSFLEMNAEHFEETDPFYAGLYIYDHNQPDHYRILNNSNHSEPENSEEKSIDQDYIKPGQGFIVKAAEGGGNVQFTSEMRAHKHKEEDGIIFKSLKSDKEPWPTVILAAYDESREASTVITFNENMSKGLDVTYDAGLFGGDPDFRLYTRLVEGDSGVDLAIQCLPDHGFEDMVIPVGIDYPEGGEVAFSTHVFTLPSGVEAVLEDRELDVFTELEGEDYNVNLSPGTEGAGRFFLHIKSEPPLYPLRNPPVKTWKFTLPRGKCL